MLMMISSTTERPDVRAVRQGLTLVHFPAQLKRFLRDKGCV